MGTAPAGFPTVTVEVAFATAPGAITPTWTDITDYVMSFQTRRGRSDELQPYSAGTLSMVLDNQDGRFDPTKTSGPYYPNVLPMRLVRVRAMWPAVAGTTYPIFQGYVDGWPMSWTLNKLDRVTVTATDAFKVLQTTPYVNAAQPVETIASRVGQILTTANIGSSLISSTTRVAADSINGQCLSLLQALEQTELGSCFMDESGLLRFEDRHYRANNKLTVQATFGDADTGELPYDVLQPVYDDTQVINTASITASKAVNPLAAPATYTDTTSQTNFLTRALPQRDLEFYDANQCADYAWGIVQRFKTPAERFASIQFSPATLGSSLWPQALGRVFGDLIRCIRRTPGGNTLDQQCHIDAIAHSFDANSLVWTTTWGLSPKAAVVSGWQLDDATNGLWGSTTVLSF
jgi:hypothetical protein